jgi:hypothetical protein
VLYRDESKTHSDESLIKMIETAQSLGMNVMLKPHVDVKDGSWRGDIGHFSSKDDYTKWFENYRTFIDHYAELAETHDVDQLCIGTEFVALTDREEEWRDIISDVRERFHGLLVYSENFDNIENNAWFGELDYIGIGGYFPLTEKTNPTISELEEAWTPHILKIISVQQKFGRKVLFTEIGYRSSDGTNIYPWAKSVDEKEQADCYTAFFETIWKKSWFAGAYFWCWQAVESNDAEGFSPQSKDAQDIITHYYGDED